MTLTPPGRTGATHAADNDRRCKADLMGFLGELAREHGDVAAFDLPRGTQLARCVLVSGPDAARELLMRREPWLRKPEWVKASNRGHWGEGLTTLEGAAWRERRTLLQPSFRAAAVAARLPVVRACTLQMLQRWPQRGTVDLVHELRLLTARIAARTVFDADIEGAPDADARAGLITFEEAYGDTFIGQADGAPWVMVRPRAPARIDGILRLIDQRLASRERRGDVLSDLIHARAPGGVALTRDEIVGELVQMLYAGHLTLPASLAQLWRDLHAHGQRLQGAGRGGAARWLPLIKESLRVQAPAPLLYREVERPFELGGLALRRDDAVWIAAQALHDDPRCFPQPARFCPARFTDGAEPVRAGTWLPFGAGARTCIGNHQALQQMALIAQCVSHRFALTPQPATAAGFFVLRRDRDGSECFGLPDTIGKADHKPTEEN